MEERVPPNGSSGGDHSDEPPNEHHNHLHSSFDSTSKPIVFTSSDQENNELNTYVVQIPKDQIYRIPPPENAKIVERYRNPSITKKQPICKRILWIIMILVIIGVLIAITLMILHQVFSPQAVVFSILDLQVRNKSHLGYDMSLKAKNPNEKVAYDFATTEGGASLFFKTTKLAKGNFPQLHQEGSESNTVHLNLAGSNGEVPEDIDKSINDNKKDHQVTLNLRMNLHANMNLGFLNLWNKDMDMDCEFKVSTLRAGTRILSQKCGS